MIFSPLFPFQKLVVIHISYLSNLARNSRGLPEKTFLHIMLSSVELFAC